MSIEENKKVVLDYMEKSAQGDGEAVSALVADDARLWLEGLGLVTKEDLLVTWVGKRKLLKKYEYEVLNVTAEEDRVAVEWIADVEALDGTRYGNVYHILCFVRNGRIVEMREHCDTAYLNYVFPGRVPKRLLALRPNSDEPYEGMKAIVAAKKAALAAQK